MDNIFIVVCTHKKAVQITEEPIYHFVIGGASFKKEWDYHGIEYFSDNELKDNISKKNPYYNEMTTLYWAWKKDIQAKYVGLAHYRRYFFALRDNRLGIRGGHILNESDCLEILSRYKVILQNYNLRPVSAVKDLRRHWDKPYKYAEQVIQHDYPEMLQSYRFVAYGYKMAYGNMMVLAKKDFESYCKWVFDVLLKIDKKMESNHETIIPRMDGYLSETLLNVWCNFRFKEKEIYRLPVLFAETKDVVEEYKYRYVSHTKFQVLSSIKRRIKHLQNYCKYIIWKT